MPNHDDGGPAFPASPEIMRINDDNTITPLGYRGMSLRDYFAGQALAFLAHPARVGVTFDPKGDAEFAYAVADAMLAARSTTTDEEVSDG